MSNSVSLEYLNTLRALHPQRFVIPFASTHAPMVNCGADGKPTVVAPAGFAYSSSGETVSLETDGTLNLTTKTDRQFGFTIPADCTIENIYIDTGTYDSFTLNADTALFPFVMLYKAASGSNIYTPMTETKTEPTVGLVDGGAGAEILSANTKNIGTALSAGERVMIIGHLESTGTGTLSYSHYIYFTGGVSFTS